MAALLKVRPTLWRRTVFAPAEAVHSYAAFLFFSKDAELSDEDVAEILETRHPRELLKAVCPDAPPRLYRALARVGDQVRGRDFYQRLFQLSRGPLSDILLDHGLLSEPRLDWAESVLEADPAIHRLAHLLPDSTYKIEAADILIRFLRASGVLSEHDMNLPAGGGVKALLRRLGHALDRITAPPRDITLSAPFQIVESIQKLRTVGRTLGVCTGSIESGGSHYWFELPTKETIFVTDESATLLAVVRTVGPNLWHVAEIKAAGNKRVSSEVEDYLEDALRDAGLEVLAKEPCRALETLTGYKDIDDLDEDAEEAAAAA